MNPAAFIEMVHRQAHRQWAEDGPRFGVSLAEFEYLRAIGLQERKQTDLRDHGQHLQDVVAHMQVSKASASAMVLKLEAAALVKRVPCRMDARAQHILLTEAGRKKLSDGEAIFAAAARAVFASLDDADRQALAALLGHPTQIA